MKKFILGIMPFIMLFVGCAGSAKAAASSGTITLDQAITEAAKEIAGDLPPQTRIAVVAFESESGSLSHYIIEELTSSLFDLKLEIAERHSLEFAITELNLHLSGSVSDEAAVSIGKFVGAEVVIIGQLRLLGPVQRFTANVIRVEEATHASSPRFDVRNDRAMRKMIAALDKQAITVRTAKYRVIDQTVPQTQGVLLDRGILFAMQGDYNRAISRMPDGERAVS